MKLRNECLGRRSQALVRIRRWKYKLNSQERAGCPEVFGRRLRGVHHDCCLGTTQTARGDDARLLTLTSSH